MCEWLAILAFEDWKNASVEKVHNPSFGSGNYSERPVTHTPRTRAVSLNAEVGERRIEPTPTSSLLSSTLLPTSSLVSSWTCPLPEPAPDRRWIVSAEEIRLATIEAEKLGVDRLVKDELDLGRYEPECRAQGDP